jgi:hypothetical protein
VIQKAFSVDKKSALTKFYIPKQPERMGDNCNYREDNVEGSGEEHIFSFEDERGQYKSDDCTDDSQDGNDLAAQEQLSNAASDDEDTDIETDISDSEGNLRV